MAITGRPIVGVFDESAMADQAIDALQNAGFSNDQMTYSGHAHAGGFLAGLKGLFSGGNTGVGSHVGSDLSNMGLSHEESQYYENEYNAGHAVVAVRANGREAEALTILRTNGAHSYNQGTGLDTAQTANTLNTADTMNTARTRDVTETDERTMKLREEQLNMNKRSVQAGEVDLRKEVVSEQQTINVPVTHEEVIIEEHPVTDGQFDNTPIGQDEVIRVPVTEEKINVTKDTVVTGEVSVGKRAVQENQQVTDTVRREEARVVREGDMDVEGTGIDTTTTNPNRNTSTNPNTRNSY